MTYSELTSFGQIDEAIFGNMRVPAREIERGLQRMELSFPLLIAAARLPKTAAEVPDGWHRGKYFWHLHPGLVYVLWPAVPEAKPVLARRGWMSGEGQLCENAEDFIDRLQNASVALRRKELAAIIRHAPLSLSIGDELDARRLALRRIRESLNQRNTLRASHWQSALEVWLETVLLRYQGQINGVQRRMVEFLSLMVCDLDSKHGMARTFRRLQREALQFYSFSEVRRRFPDMVMELLQEFPLGFSLQPQELSPITERALAWIEQQFHRPVTVADCAAAIPVSATYLCRLLRRETGFSPVQHLQYQRIAHAKQLLQENRWGIEEIAGRSGFGSVEHFYRVFRQQTGMTPAAYRRNAYK